MANEELTGLVVKIRADLSDYVLKLSQMEQQSDKTTKSVSDEFNKLTSVFTKVGTGVAAFAATAIQSASAWGNAVDDLADTTGMAGEEASKFLTLGKATGVAVDTTNAVIGKFSRTVYNAADAYSKAADSGKASSDVLTQLGVSALNADGSMRSTLEVFMDVKNSLNGMEDGWQKTAYEMQLFGKSGYEMHDMLSMTDEEMTKAINKAQAFGLIISSETAAGWEKFERQLKSTKGLMTSVGITIGNEMLPKLQQMLGDVQNVTKAYVNMDDRQKAVINTLIEVVAKIGIATTAIKGIEWVIGRSLGPWGLFAAAIWQSVDALKALKTENGKVQEVFVFDGPNHGRTIKIRDMPTEHGGASRWEDFNKKFPKEQKNEDTFLGGGGVGADSKTALQEYQSETQKLISLWDAQVKLEEMSKERYRELLAERLAGTTAVAANDGEELEKRQAQYDLLIKIFDASEQSRQSVIEQSQQQRQLGNITNEQLAETLTKQYELAGSERERISILLQLKSVYEQLKTAANDYYETVQRQLEDEAEQLNKELAEAKKRGEKSARNDLRNIGARFGTNDFKNQLNEITILANEYDDKLNQYKLGALDITPDQAQELHAKLIALMDARESLINDQVVYEIDAARRSKEAWANNLADIISGTRSAHDILKQQWKEFITEVLKQQLKISASSNVFNSLLGGVFGLNKTKTPKSPEFELNPVTVVAGARAAGGPVEAGKAYLVGEKRAEVFVPRVNGEILPDVSLYTGRASYQNQGTASNSMPDIKVNVVNNTGTQATPKVSQQYDSQLKSFIIDVTLDGVTRNVNGLQDAVAAAGRRGR